MKKFIQEFKEFAFSGNLVTLAVAFIMAGAFGALVTSLVENVVTPLIAAIGGKQDFSEVGFDIGDGHIALGLFINALITFISIAFVMFMLVKAYKAYEARKKTGEVPADEPSDEVKLLSEIRDSLRARG